MAERAHPESPDYRKPYFRLFGKNKYRKQFFETYKFAKPFIHKKVVLDVPCGVGWGTSLLRSARLRVGIDEEVK